MFQIDVVSGSHWPKYWNMSPIFLNYDICWDLQQTNWNAELLKKFKVYFCILTKIHMHAKLYWNHNHLKVFYFKQKKNFTIQYCTFLSSTATLLPLMGEMDIQKQGSNYSYCSGRCPECLSSSFLCYVNWSSHALKWTSPQLSLSIKKQYSSYFDMKHICFTGGIRNVLIFPLFIKKTSFVWGTIDVFTRKPKWMLVTEVMYIKTRRTTYQLCSLLPVHKEARGNASLGHQTGSLLDAVRWLYWKQGKEKEKWVCTNK